MSSKLLPSLAGFVLTCLAAGSAGALTTNPIDPGQPTSIHAVTTCPFGQITYPGNTLADPTALTEVGSSAASCSGFYEQENGATLTQVFGNGTARADLATGQLEAVATGRSYVDDTQALNAGAFSNAAFYDTLTVNGTWSGAIPIELRMAVDGSFLTNADPENWTDTDVNAKLILLSGAGSLYSRAGIFIRQGNVGTFIQDSIGAVTNATNGVFDPSDVRFTFDLIYLATMASPTFSFVANVGVDAAIRFNGVSGVFNEGTADFGNTAQLSLVVPDGVTVSSESGQFLVPAPPAIVLLGTAFGALLPALRRRAA